MRKSDYPQYFGGTRQSRGPRIFLYWCATVKEWSHYVSKRAYRQQLVYWLDIDCPLFK